MHLAIAWLPVTGVGFLCGCIIKSGECEVGGEPWASAQSYSTSCSTQSPNLLGFPAAHELPGGHIDPHHVIEGECGS